MSEPNGFRIDNFIGTKKALTELLTVSLNGIPDDKVVQFKGSCKSIRIKRINQLKLKEAEKVVDKNLNALKKLSKH